MPSIIIQKELEFLLSGNPPPLEAEDVLAWLDQINGDARETPVGTISLNVPGRNFKFTPGLGGQPKQKPFPNPPKRRIISDESEDSVIIISDSEEREDIHKRPKDRLFLSSPSTSSPSVVIIGDTDDSERDEDPPLPNPRAMSESTWRSILQDKKKMASWVAKQKLRKVPRVSFIVLYASAICSFLIVPLLQSTGVVLLLPNGKKTKRMYRLRGA